ncbi:rhodanese-like domain-containing protein [Streptomyces guryensis]|uniref:Rhodanese-like domain-containing protein n=1 Tax=Streptomyces guryensis TaxID=2886947 RepID=A0A9Q3ZBX2_9ACTN|nr:rhodanese-like domain-containing protein [Streptomyces guryensis]MCD9880769.1 rhodanese-like domain-containing protein [Streptomyces guryensis]
MSLNLFRRGPGRVGARLAAECTGHVDGVPAERDAVLLDVRESYEWQAGHAPGAVQVSLSALMAGAALPEQLAGRPLVVICRSGNRSRQAAELLAARGAEAVDVIGGMRDWARLGLPVVDGHGESGTVT